MFLENGNIFIVNCKPFINKSHISCGCLKHAFVTPARNNLPNVKTYYHHNKITY